MYPFLSEKSSALRAKVSLRGVFSTKEQDSSVGGDAGYVCLGEVHMEEEVQVRVQVEEEGIGETHGEEQGKGTESQRTDNRTTWMTMQMKCRARADT